MSSTDKEELIQKLTAWVQSIGIPVRVCAADAETFLPGLTIENGVLIVDPARLQWPGDILHEAGHIAVSPPSQRPVLGGKLQVTPGDEMAALAWSYAAALGAGIDPAIVFHSGGYRNGGAELLSSYTAGLAAGGPGAPMLQWYRMTKTFPVMDNWLRQCEDPTAGIAI